MSHVPLAMIGLGSLGGGELIVVLVVFVLLFGPRKIPELMRGFGEGIRELKRGLSGIDTLKDEVVDKVTPRIES